MAEDKEIRIRAVLDASTFDKGINEIQEKLRKITQQQVQGSGAQKALGKDSVMGKYAQQAFGDFSKESQRQLEQMYQIQRREAVNQQVTMRGKQQELEKMLKIDGEMTKQQKERTENIKKEIELLKEKQRLTLTTAAETQKALDKMGGGAGGGGPGAPGGGDATQPGGGGAGFFGQMLKTAGAAAIVRGVINASLMGLEDSITRDRKISMNNASTMRMGSREMREGMAGQGSRGLFWGSERERAMRSAAKEQQSMGTLDMLKVAGGTAAGAITGGVAGFFGGLGFGAIPGAIGGGIAGFGATMASSEKLRARTFDQEKYKSMMTKEGMEKYEQNLAAEKAKNPRKEIAREYFEQNYGNMVGLQRLGGIGTDEGLIGRGGALQVGMRSGGQFGGVNFSQQTIQDQMQALASGGAMTSGVRQLGGSAATFNRQFNLSNAGQIMGRMQGNTGMNSTMTDMAYQRLIEAGVKLGVNASTMPREMEKLTQLTAELITSGGVNATGMGQLFGAGLTGFNAKAQEAAASAAEGYKTTAKGAAGWEGQMGFGFLQSKEAQDLLGGKELTADQMNMLNQTSAAELDEEGFQRIADYLDIPVDNAKQLLKKKDKFKQGRTGQEDESYQNLQNYLKEQGADTVEKRQNALKTKTGRQLLQTAITKRGAAHADFLQKSQVAQQAEILTQVGAEEGAPPTAADIELDRNAQRTVDEQKRKQVTRAGEIEEGAAATGDITRMQTLSENLEDFKKAAKGYTENAVIYEKQFALMVEATKKGATAMDGIANELSAINKKLNEESGGNSTVPSAQPYSGSYGGDKERY